LPPPPPAEVEPIIEVFEEPIVEETLPAEKPKPRTCVWSLIIGGLIGCSIDWVKN
jgi:hypothetical protein